VYKLCEKALYLTNAKIDDNKITQDFLITAANECQMAITQFMYQDPRSGRLVQMDWDFEVAFSDSLTVSTNELAYSLSSIYLKYPYSDKGIIDVRIGDNDLLKPTTIDMWDKMMIDVHTTQLSAEATAGATSITVDSTITFGDSGTIYLGGDTLTYTGTTSTTFTGIPASGTGAITETHAVDSNIWQNVGPGFPDYYVIDREYLKFSQPVDSDYDGYPIKIRFYKKLTALSELSDTTSVNFYNVFPLFIAGRIEERKGSLDRAKYYFDQFKEQVLSNALTQRVPSADVGSYWKMQSSTNYYFR
jgi:hypothetical protein